MKSAIRSMMFALSTCCACGQTLTLQQFDHKSWGAREQAPLETSVFAQDGDGILWLGSINGGLFSFDGLHFEPFVNQGYKPDFSAGILSLASSRDGSLWVGFATGGIAELRHHELARYFGKQEGLPSVSTRQILQSPDGTMLAIAGEHLYREALGKWKEDKAASPLASEQVRRVFFDKVGTLWLATMQSVYLRKAGESQFQKTAEKGGIVNKFAEGPHGDLWMLTTIPGSPNVLRRLRVGLYSDRKPVQLQGALSDFLIDSEDMLWLSNTAWGIYRLDAERVSSLSLTESLSVKGNPIQHFRQIDGLTADPVFRLFMDRSGSVWALTSSGIDRFTRPHLIRFLDPVAFVDSMLASCPKGDVWIGPDRSSALLSVTGDHVERHASTPESTTSIFCDQNGKLFFSFAATDGLWSFSNTFKQLPTPKNFPIRQIAGKADDLFVSVTRRGIWRYHNAQWSRVSVPGFPDDTAVSLLQDRRDRIWAGFIDGRVGQFDGQVGQTFLPSPGASLGMVEVILDSSYGILAGGANGLVMIRSDRLEKLSVESQQIVRGVSGLVEAKNGDIWVNGSSGIIRIPAQEVRAAIASPGYRMRCQPLQEVGINGPAPQLLYIPTAVSDKAGRLWFSTSRAVVSLDPASIVPDTNPPVLTNISTTVDGQPLAQTGKISSGPHTVRIAYQGISLDHANMVTYRYRLDGVDNGWQDAGKRAEAVYTALPPGKFHFHVMASNGEEVWTPPDDSLSFTVLPAFYQTFWFRLGCLSALVIVGWTLYLLRVRQVVAGVRGRLEERMKERERIARDLHDTLLQGFQGILLRIDSVTQLIPSTDPAREMLERALLRADQVIVEGRDRVKDLRETADKVKDLSEAFAAVGLERAKDSNVDFRVSVEGRPELLHPVVHDEMFCIGREALLNAFDHAHANLVDISCCYRADEVSIRVRDDGPGIAQNILAEGRRKGHWGIVGMHERAQKIGSTLTISCPPGRGTEVQLRVPALVAYVNVRKGTRLQQMIRKVRGG